MAKLVGSGTKRARNPVGRPTKYRKKYCQMLIDHMAKGLAFESFASKLEVGFKTIYQWRHDYPEFQQAYQIGQAKSFEIWERLGMKGMTNPGKLAPSIWAYNMRCRFGKSEFSPTDRANSEGQGEAFDGFDI